MAPQKWSHWRQIRFKLSTNKKEGRKELGKKNEISGADVGKITGNVNFFLFFFFLYLCQKQLTSLLQNVRNQWHKGTSLAQKESVRSLETILSLFSKPFTL